ncbi:MAG TPA: DUF455 family protein [Candidatus Binatia bacterium]|nr:DUF455 family protein [Candidatus Binatia bacterium]
MPESSQFLLTSEQRARWMRFDTAQLLKRFFFCERSLLVSEASWIPAIAPLDIKTGLARFIWQSAETADCLRERVFELRFPSRLLEEEGNDRALIELFDAAKHSPSVSAFLLCLGNVLLPALRDGYQAYLEASDAIADGPTHRFLQLALAEKVEAITAFGFWTNMLMSPHNGADAEAVAWANEFAKRLSAMGGVGVESSITSVPTGALPGAKDYSIPVHPARDPRFWPCRFYWPDIVDPSYPYGEGIQLQLRAAISHLNEVWAVEAGGVMLSAFADVLPWEWIYNSARWTYDESRHCRMGYERLMSWQLDPAEIPLGTYIYESATTANAVDVPTNLLGMLYFFETKNIRHKPARRELFHSYGDSLSEHDMDFDWADETLHASYGKRWLKELLAVRGQGPGAYEEVRKQCETLANNYVATATSEEIKDLKIVATSLLDKAKQFRRCP